MRKRSDQRVSPVATVAPSARFRASNDRRGASTTTCESQIARRDRARKQRAAALGIVQDADIVGGKAAGVGFRRFGSEHRRSAADIAVGATKDIVGAQDCQPLR